MHSVKLNNFVLFISKKNCISSICSIHWEIRNAYKILVEQKEEKTTIDRHRSRSADNNLLK
jgi:hypothetical protein